MFSARPAARGNRRHFFVSDTRSTARTNNTLHVIAICGCTARVTDLRVLYRKHLGFRTWHGVSVFPLHGTHTRIRNKQSDIYTAIGCEVFIYYCIFSRKTETFILTLYPTLVLVIIAKLLRTPTRFSHCLAHIRIRSIRKKQSDCCI